MCIEAFKFAKNLSILCKMGVGKPFAQVHVVLAWVFVRAHPLVARLLARFRNRFESVCSGVKNVKRIVFFCILFDF